MFGNYLDSGWNIFSFRARANRLDDWRSSDDCDWFDKQRILRENQDDIKRN